MGFEFGPGKTRIGWVGTGVMGSSMCGHLIAAGYQATIYNRTVEKTKALAAKGAVVAASIAELAAASDVVFTIVGYPRDVREVILGPQRIVASAKPGSIVVDMSTSEPALAIEIFEAAKRHSIHAVDAPVSGGDIGAKEARLSIMIGGE
jgi:3-hydroxyisobutyrate dehydrogenase